MSGGGSSSNGTKDPHPNPLGSNPVNKAYEFNTTYTSDGPTDFNMATPVPEQSSVLSTPTSHPAVSTRPIPRTSSRPALTRQITDIDRRAATIPAGPEVTSEDHATYISDGTTSASSEQITGPISVVGPYETPNTPNTTDGPTSNYELPMATGVRLQGLPSAGVSDSVQIQDFAPTSDGRPTVTTSRVPVTVSLGTVGLWDLRTVDTTPDGSPMTTCDTPAGVPTPSSTIATVSALTQTSDTHITGQNAQPASSTIAFTMQRAVTTVVAALLAIHLYGSAKDTRSTQPRLSTTLALAVLLAVSCLTSSADASDLGSTSDGECNGSCLIVFGVGLSVICIGILSILIVVGMQLSKKAGCVRHQETLTGIGQSEAEREGDEGRRRTRAEDVGVGKGDAML